MPKKKLKIWCYDTESETLYELYEQILDPDYDAPDRIVDAKTYSESGIDVLYFTDNYNEPRRLRCEIESYSPLFLDDYDLSLTRQGGKGHIRFNPYLNSPSNDAVVSTGGSLLSGTYQFAFRLVNPTTNKISKWSSLSNPVHVYAQEDATEDYFNSGYGLATNRRIKVYADYPQDEVTAFAGQYVQFAVVENIYPSPTTALYASLLPLQSDPYLDYKSNYKIGTIPIEDLVVDYAPVQKSKTLTILRNRMFLGNIKYTDLEFDGDTTVFDGTGKPYVSSGSVYKKEISTASNLSQNLEKYASLYKGYFRDEVYRFGIVYLDKYGNRSQVHVLNMSNVTDNKSPYTYDMKFPKRSDAGYSILTSTNEVRSLGLSLTIQNHPTWATAFEIVREERIKRVLFQTPCIPMASVKGIGALESYPSSGLVESSTQTYTDAQPMTSDTVYVPKNLLFPELRNIVKNYTTGGSGDNRKITGEARYERGITYNYACLFPQENLYEAKGYEFKGYEKIETIDCVFASVNSKIYEPKNDSSLLEASFVFYGMSSDRYFYNDNVSPSANDIISEKSSIQDAIYLDNYSSGDTLGGSKIESYKDLQTYGVPMGYTPNVQRKVVCKINTSFNDEGAYAIPFSIGNHNAYAAGGAIYASVASPSYEDTASYTNNIYPLAAWYNTNPYQVVRIVNVVNENIGDDRYGDLDSQRKFISTGTSYYFDDDQIIKIKKKIQVPVVVEVFGGDCFITNHVFKVSDSTYLPSNPRKFFNSAYNTATISNNYDVAFKLTSYSAALSIPVGIKGAAQFVQVMLESEYNGQAMDTDILKIKSQYITPIIDGSGYVLNLENITSAKGSVKSCLTYNTNVNIKFNNEQKVYFPKLTYSFVRNLFQSRIQYSDLKIYNSSEIGFDIFRVANFYDMEESGGPITKLALASDNMYGIQTKRISYLPAGERIIEAADNGVLAVGTSSVISQASIINERRGGQHLAGIVETGDQIMIPDNINKSVYMLQGQQLEIISDKDVASLFREKLGTVFVEKNIRGLWDPIRKEYWLVAKDQSYFCYLYNMSIEQWVSNYEFSSAAIFYNGVFTNQKLWLLGKESTDVNVYTMYTGEYTILMGSDVTPRITLIVNPDADYAKTFDDLAIAATERLKDVDFVVEREQSMGQQLVSEVNLDVFPVEGNYRIKTLRDPRDERLRGLRMKTTVRWMSNDLPSMVSSIYTKYRLSARRPF